MVVSDSSALINLARIGKLALLRDLYGEVYIPEAVWQEAVVRGRDRLEQVRSSRRLGSKLNV